MKKVLAGICAALVMGASAFAQAPSININGTVTEIAPDMGAPYIENDRTMLPIRAVFEQTGATVTWIEAEQNIMINKQTDEGVVMIMLQIDNSTAFVKKAADADFSQTELDAPATLVGERSYIPLRFVAEALGCEVDWDSEAGTVLINM